MSGKKYAIKSVWDFAKVPDDRLDLCLKEFGVCVRMSRASIQLIDAIADEMRVALEVRPLFAMTDTFTWIDDDEGVATIHIRVPEADTPQAPCARDFGTEAP